MGILKYRNRDFLDHLVKKMYNNCDFLKGHNIGKTVLDRDLITLKEEVAKIVMMIDL